MQVTAGHCSVAAWPSEGTVLRAGDVVAVDDEVGQRFAAELQLGWRLLWFHGHHQHLFREPGAFLLYFDHGFER